MTIPLVSVDTEYNEHSVPFIGTSCDTMLKPEFFDLRTKEGVANLKRICESPKIVKIFHSATSDIYALSKRGIDVKPPYEDTLIAASLINENYASRKLKDMAKILLGEDCDESKVLGKAKAKLTREAKKQGKKFSYEMFPADLIKPYALKDPEYTIKLWFMFRNQLQDYRKLYDFEKKLIPIIVKMQQEGLMVDRAFVKQKLKESRKRLDELADNMSVYLWKKKIRFYNKKKVKIQFKPNSSKHVAKIIRALQIPITKVTAKGETATDSNTLMDYRNHPFIKDYLEYKFWYKQYGTYYSPIYAHYTSDAYPFAHFSFYQSGAKTGRFSAELIQTMPRPDEDQITKKGREIRKMFIAPPGYRLIALDYSQVEMRVFVHFAKAKAMAKHIINGLDPHMGTAYDIFGAKFMDKLDEKGRKRYRRIMKDINFGIIYGMGKNKLKRQMRSYGIDLTDEECETILDNYYEKYPVREFIQETTGKLYRQGSITMSVDSPLMKFTREYRIPQHLAYKGANALVQGMSAYILKHAMVRMDTFITEGEYDIKMIATIHDEILLKVSNKYSDNYIVPKLVDVMEDNVTFDVPITVTPKVGKNFLEMKEWKKAT